MFQAESIKFVWDLGVICKPFVFLGRMYAALEEQSFKRNLLRSGGTHCETVI